MKTLARSIATVFTSTLVVGSLSSAAAAAQLYANSVEYYNNNGTAMDSYRQETENALGAPQPGSTQDFLSLGFGGEAIFGFGAAISGEITVWETTWGVKNQQSDYDERVEVFVGNNLDGEWFSVGTIQNIADGAYYGDGSDGYPGASVNTQDLYGNQAFNYVRLVDQSPERRGRDGFDVNAIAAAPADVPEPAAALGLVMALGAATRLRRQTA